MQKILPSLIIALFLGFTPVAVADETKCRHLVRLTDFDHAVEPGQWIAADESTPAHCRVRGVVNRAIRFEVTLPIEWNGRMMFSTVGGYAGVIGDTTSLLSRGFAMASTDTGHDISEDGEFIKQPQAFLDYAYRGVHLATQAAKRVITHYYDEPIDFAYLQGCSNGGRAALLEAIHFPDDYDGIIAGAPVFQFYEMSPWMLGVARAQEKHPLTHEALALLDRNSTSACDALDGVEDGVINDPRECTLERLDLEALVCAAGQTDDCLTEGQLETAEYVYGPVRNAKGEFVSHGVMPGGEAGGDWAAWQLPNGPLGAASVVSGFREQIRLIMRSDPTFDVDAFDPVTERDRIRSATTPLDIRTADLSEFRDGGGKLLMYQGFNDYPLRPGRAIDYLQAVRAGMDGATPSDEFFRLFMVPGMLHCRGGPGAWQADYVDPIVAWRENGEPPTRIIATQPGEAPNGFLVPHEDFIPTERFTRPICPFPEMPTYTGGDPDIADSFACRASD